MQIHSLQHTQAAQSVGRTGQQQPAGNTGSPSVRTSTVADQLDLSSEAQQISQLQASGASAPVKGGTSSEGIRTEKVAAIRQAIAEGTYESSDKLSAALDRLLDTFA